MNIYKMAIPMNFMFDDANLALTSVSTDFEYVDGKKTENIVGTKYEVVETKRFERFIVKVPDKNPVIRQEQLDEYIDNEIKVYVRFDNPVMRLYRKPDGSTDGSIKADKIHLIRNHD